MNRDHYSITTTAQAIAEQIGQFALHLSAPPGALIAGFHKARQRETLGEIQRVQGQLSEIKQQAFSLAIELVAMQTPLLRPVSFADIIQSNLQAQSQEKKS